MPGFASWLAASPLPSRSIALGGAIDEQRAAGHALLAGLEPGAHLDFAVADPTHADVAHGQRLVVSRDPDPRRLAFIDDGILGHRRRGGVVAGDDAESLEILRLQSAFGVLDLCLNRQSMRVGIDRRRDITD